METHKYRKACSTAEKSVTTSDFIDVKITTSPTTVTTMANERLAFSRRRKIWLLVSPLLCFLAIFLFHDVLPTTWTSGRVDARKLVARKHKATSYVKKSQHAYAFLVAGCDPEKSGYMAGIYGLLVANEILKQSGSTSDVVVMIRMASTTDEDNLPNDVETLLEKAGVIIKYLPKPQTENFYTAQMEKFRILSWTEYTRVLYMDTDVMPLCNLDYIFNLSEGDDAVLKENLLVAGSFQPASGGFFMLRPEQGSYDAIQQIVREREMNDELNTTEGWGHVIRAPDKWKAIKKAGRGWGFYAGFADQGLLYHWAKYVKKNVSIVIDDVVETWGTMDNDRKGEVQLLDLSRVILKEGCVNRKKLKNIPKLCNFRHAPGSDFVHFCAKGKPWLKGGPMLLQDISSTTPYYVWYETLSVISRKYGYKVDMKNLTLSPALGGRFTHEQIVEKVTRKKGE